MTNAINSGLPAALPETTQAAASAASLRPGNNPAGITANTAGTEAVTLSADAQTRTQLLDSARTAPGADQAAVAQARTAIQNNSYNISPEDLATAIATASKERQP
jgi:anti-sigma28 factor (negative regulator of flagellin synthesis)